MANEVSRPDMDFMAPEYALRGNDADTLQVDILIVFTALIKKYVF